MIASPPEPPADPFGYPVGDALYWKEQCEQARAARDRANARNSELVAALDHIAGYVHTTDSVAGPRLQNCIQTARAALAKVQP